MLTYLYEKTEYAKNSTFRNSVVILQYAVSLFCLIIVIVGNSLLVYHLHKNLKSVKQIRKYTVKNVIKKQNEFLIELNTESNQKAEINVTKLVCFMSILFTINQISIQIINTALIKMDTSSYAYNFIVIFYNICAFLFHGANIFLYKIYNDDFSSRLKFQFLKASSYLKSSR